MTKGRGERHAHLWGDSNPRNTYIRQAAYFGKTKWNTQEEKAETCTRKGNEVLIDKIHVGSKTKMPEIMW